MEHTLSSQHQHQPCLPVFFAILDVRIGPTFLPSTAVILPCSMFTMEKTNQIVQFNLDLTFCLLLLGMESVKSIAITRGRKQSRRSQILQNKSLKLCCQQCIYIYNVMCFILKSTSCCQLRVPLSSQSERVSHCDVLALLTAVDMKSLKSVCLHANICRHNPTVRLLLRVLSVKICYFEITSNNLMLAVHT